MPATILIVDDEPNIIVPLQFLMEQNGYRVLVAQSGEEAIESIMQYRPDLVLLDIMLPGIDGYEVCEIIRLNPEWKDTRVIFLTAKGRDMDMAKGMVLGADAFITKPFSNADVIRQVKALLEKKNAAGPN
jgi:DNA-binding response OmpR family regulator